MKKNISPSSLFFPLQLTFFSHSLPPLLLHQASSIMVDLISHHWFILQAAPKPDKRHLLAKLSHLFPSFRFLTPGICSDVKLSHDYNSHNPFWMTWPAPENLLWVEMEILNYATPLLAIIPQPGESVSAYGRDWTEVPWLSLRAPLSIPADPFSAQSEQEINQLDPADLFTAVGFARFYMRMSKAGPCPSVFQRWDREKEFYIGMDGWFHRM